MTAPAALRTPLALALALAAAPAPAAPGPTPFTRARMETALAAAPGFRFVYGTRDAERTASLRARAYETALRVYGADSSRVVADRVATEAELAAGGVVLLGGPDENAWTRRLAPELPVRFTAPGFEWHGTRYAKPGDAIVLTWPNPLAPKSFLVLAAANSAAATARLSAALPAGEDWRITRDGELARSGRFAQSEAAPWRYDPALDRDREAERARYVATLVAQGGAPLVVRAPAGLAPARSTRAAGVALLARLDSLGLRAPARAAPLSLTLYPSLETKGLLTRDTRPEHLERGAAHAALPAGRAALDLWSVAAARLVSLGASERSRFLEPAGAWLCGRFEGEPIALAIARLYDGRVLPTAADAATRDRNFRSPLVRTPARALLARAVFETARAPRTALLALLAPDLPGTLDSLCRAAHADPGAVAARYLRLASTLAREGRGPLALVRPRPWRPSDGFMAGACLSHTVDLELGYLSASAARELAAMKKDGAGWVSLSPVAYVPDLHTPRVLPSARGGPDEESDEAVCEAAARARALGLRVWLAPRLWTRGWPGDLEFTPADWPRFFAAYREALIHWALLAERERLDGLVMGRDLASSTACCPERWRELIADIRAIYTGTLTYEANADEVARVPFWDALDLVDVTFDFALSDTPTRDPGRLRAGAGKALASLAPIARRFHRPVLVGELGYPALPTAAVRPWEGGRGAPDAATQAACFEAALSVIDRPLWVAGVLAWKWPSGEPAGVPDDDPFSIRGRPAERTIRGAFQGWAQRPVRVP